MKVSLEGRTALVTGASRGIGKAIALALAEAGADVAVNYRREADEAEKVVAEIKAMGRKAKAYGAAVDDDALCEKLIGDVVADFGSLSILINNAGIASRGNTVLDTDHAELRRVLNVHAVAPAVISKYAIPHLRKAGRADIIMISSVATLYMSANGAPYNMAKAAEEALARTIAKEERAHGIRCNIVAPSLTVTDMGTKLAKARGTANISDLDASSPFGRVSVPEDVAAACVWLVSDANPYANGQKINIDGGNF